MPRSPESLSPPSPERKAPLTLKNARGIVGEYLKPAGEKHVGDDEFLFSFGMLVRKKSKLGSLAADVDIVAGSLISQAKDPDPAVSGNALIPNFLKGALREALEELRQKAETGGRHREKKELREERETFENYSAAASALEMGGEDNPQIQTLLDQCREGLYKPDSAGRRILLKAGLAAGGVLAAGGLGVTARILSNLESASTEKVVRPGPSRPKAPLQPLSSPPSPTALPSPSPEASPSPTSSPATKETPLSKPVPEKTKTPEAETPPKSELIGFTVSSPEEIEALPPSIGIVRIATDTNLMYPDGSFQDNRFEEILAAADRKGLKVILTYKASWFPGIAGRKLSPGDLEKSNPVIRNHLRTFLKHPSVQYIEVGNEIDQNIPGREDQFWEGSMDDYAKLFKLVSDNIKTLSQETGNQAELILSSFADPMGYQNNKVSEKYFAELVRALNENGVSPDQFLVAGHAYHLETLQWILNNLQGKVGTKGIIITELNVTGREKKHQQELENMLKLLAGRETAAVVQSFVSPKDHDFDFYAISQRDPRFLIVMDAVSRDLERAKNPKPNKAPEQNKIPPKEARVFYPQELSYEEVRPWIGKLRDSHDAVLTESLFTKEMASLSQAQRERVLDAIAQAHAQALCEYYGDTDAIIGLDPGHGGSDVGSGAIGADGKSLAEKDLTWTITNLTAQKLYELSKGKYKVVVLRPEIPHDEDLDGDGQISPIERLQKRKAQLLKMEGQFRPNSSDRGRNIVYCSIHLNGSPDGTQRGTEVYWPNRTAMESDTHRNSSKQLALILQRHILKSTQQVGLATLDRGAKEDPDSSEPGSNSDTAIGPYVALGSKKLDRILLRA